MIIAQIAAAQMYGQSEKDAIAIFLLIFFYVDHRLCETKTVTKNRRKNTIQPIFGVRMLRLLVDALKPSGGRIGFFDGGDGDGSASKDPDLGCHRFMADGLGGRNRHHGTF